MTLCNTFKRLSFETWDTIQRGRSVNYQMKEETLTDYNMLELKLRHSSQIRTRVFTKPEEGINGADWEWWFKGNSNKWIGFRIQAKILNIQSEEFEHLHYQTRSTGVYQSDKLINNALGQLIPRIPLYCLFLQTDNNSLLNKWNCRTIGQIKDLYGCSLTSAFTIRNLRTTNSKHLSQLENHIEPWHCLVCCSGFGRSDFITNIESYALNNFNLNDNNLENTGREIPESFITKNPPDYVLQLLENEKNDNLKRPDEDLSGITIILEDSKK